MATYYWVGGNGTWDNSTKTNCNSGWYFAPQLGRPLPAFAF